jgi:hypothetical protein
MAFVDETLLAVRLTGTPGGSGGSRPSHAVNRQSFKQVEGTITPSRCHCSGTAGLCGLRPPDLVIGSEDYEAVTLPRVVCR